MPITLLAFGVVLGVLVFVHELGHYGVARLFGVRAETFSIGFGRPLAAWTDARGTRWKLGWLPLGGYVQFAGDADASSRPDADIELTPQAERAGLHHFAPLWQKAAISAAGPLTNLLFAVLVYATFFAAFGRMVTPAVVGRVAPNSPAAAAGIVPGDRILTVDGATVTRFEDVVDRTALNLGDPMRLRLERGGLQREVVVTPRLVHERDVFGKPVDTHRFGIGSNGAQVIAAVPPLQIVPAAVAEVASVIRSQVVGIGQVVSGRRSVKEMGGPVKLAQLSGQVAALGFGRLVEFMAFVSINLAFINLLPIPMLDGGHLFLYALQAVRRRPLGTRVQQWAFASGFAALVSLMVLLTWNDLGSIGVWKHLTGLLG